MMTIAVALSIVCALLCGGSFSALAKAELKGIGFLIPAVCLRFFLYMQGAAGAVWVADWAPVLLTLSYGMLLYAVYLNREHKGAILFGAGTLANYLVIAVNGWRMPISREGLLATGQEGMIEYLKGPADYVHGLLTEDTKLAVLADIFYLPEPFPRPTVFSIGDVFIISGVFLLIFTMMAAKLPRSLSR